MDLFCGGLMNLECVKICSADLERISAGRHTGMGDAANRETTLPRRDRKLIP